MSRPSVANIRLLAPVAAATVATSPDRDIGAALLPSPTECYRLPAIHGGANVVRSPQGVLRNFDLGGAVRQLLRSGELTRRPRVH